MEQLILAGVAMLIALYQLFALRRILTEISSAKPICSEVDVAAVTSTSLPHASLSEIARTIDHRTSAAVRRINSHVEQLLRNLPAPSVSNIEKPIMDKLAALESEVKDLRDNEKRYVKINELARASEEIRDELQEISESLHSTVDAVRVYTENAIPHNEGLLEERLVSLEKLLEEFLASPEAHGSLADLAETVRGLQHEVEISRKHAEEARQVAGSISDAATRLPDLERSVETLMSEVGSWRSVFEGLRQELTAKNSRMNNEQAVSVKETSRPTARRPRVLSAKARASYTEVMGLWSKGISADTIANTTGLELSEVDLIIAGETQKMSSADQ